MSDCLGTGFCYAHVFLLDVFPKYGLRLITRSNTGTLMALMTERVLITRSNTGTLMALMTERYSFVFGRWSDDE